MVARLASVWSMTSARSSRSPDSTSATTSSRGSPPCRTLDDDVHLRDLLKAADAPVASASACSGSAWVACTASRRRAATGSPDRQLLRDDPAPRGVGGPGQGEPLDHLAPVTRPGAGDHRRTRHVHAARRRGRARSGWVSTWCATPRPSTGSPTPPSARPTARPTPPTPSNAPTPGSRPDDCTRGLTPGAISGSGVRGGRAG
jgi:hypothetical protein